MPSNWHGGFNKEKIELIKIVSVYRTQSNYYACHLRASCKIAISSHTENVMLATDFVGTL